MRRAFLAAVLLLGLPGAGAAELVRLRCVLHAHSARSFGGSRPLVELAREARARGVDVFIPTDLLLARWEYGLWPLRGLVRRVREGASVLKDGAQSYLREIEEAGRQVPGLILIPGAEAAPFYYWTGSPFDGSLTIHGWHRHLLVLGLRDAAAYGSLPITSSRLAPGLDPYHGDRGAAPYQSLIDAATKRGALVFWAHPDARNHQERRRLGPVWLQTPPYPDLVLATRGHSGFAAFREGLPSVEPGGPWDKALLEHVSGRRSEPPWVVAEADWYGKPDEAPPHDAHQVLWAQARTAQAALEALHAGRFYAVRLGQERHEVVIEDFSLSAGGRRAVSGESLRGAGPARLRLTARSSKGLTPPVRVRVVGGGLLLLDRTQTLPLDLDLPLPGGCAGGYVRAMIQEEDGASVLTNPIFCRR